MGTAEGSDSRPFQGEARYWHVQLLNGEIIKDIAWSYRYPTLESSSIRGYVCFYDEKVDMWVDGEKQARPATHFA